MLCVEHHVDMIFSQRGEVSPSPIWHSVRDDTPALLCRCHTPRDALIRDGPLPRRAHGALRRPLYKFTQSHSVSPSAHLPGTRVLEQPRSTGRPCIPIVDVRCLQSPQPTRPEPGGLPNMRSLRCPAFRCCVRLDRGPPFLVHSPLTCIYVFPGIAKTCESTECDQR